jgi:hypothetical protein
MLKRGEYKNERREESERKERKAKWERGGR